MNYIIIITTLSIIISLTSIIYNKKFILSILICLEGCLLNLIILNFTSILFNNNNQSLLSIFIITLSAVEASIGISLITLTTRNFNENNINNLNTLII
uniref:NADH-ubiquinone oxidoreductase chain 4L n=1 Tax=Ophiotreta durbanensis TaxID=3135534 RepID=A0AAU6PWX6_9ECHI